MSFDIPAYMGMWYEVGRLPFIFEQNCESASARYVYDEQRQGIHALNICYSDKEFKKVSRWDQGFAHQTDSTNRGDLMIKFFGYGDVESPYIVFETDYTSYSIVGSEDKNLLWIMVRDKKITKRMLNTLIEKVIGLGFDTQFLILNESMIV